MAWTPKTENRTRRRTRLLAWLVWGLFVFGATSGGATSGGASEDLPEGLGVLVPSEQTVWPDVPILIGAERFFLSDLTQGRVVVVNFWASWCAPCRRELPDLRQLVENRPDVALVLLNEDDESDAFIEAFFRENGLEDLPRGRDAQFQIWQALALRGLPTSLILDKKGVVRYRADGFVDWQDPAVLSLLDALRAEGL